MSTNKLTLDPHDPSAGKESVPGVLWQSGFWAELLFVASLHAPLAFLPSRQGG